MISITNLLKPLPVKRTETFPRQQLPPESNIHFGSCSVLHCIYFCTQSFTSPWLMLSVFLTTLNKAYCIVLYCIVFRGRHSIEILYLTQKSRTQLVEITLEQTRQPWNVSDSLVLPLETSQSNKKQCPVARLYGCVCVYSPFLEIFRPGQYDPCFADALFKCLSYVLEWNVWILNKISVKYISGI